MGISDTLFGAEYSTVAGLSFVSLRGNAFAEYPKLYKNIVASANFDMDIIGNQLVQYKSGYRKNITQNIVDRYGLTIQNILILSEDTQAIKDSIFLRNGLSFPADYSDVIESTIADIVTMPVPNANTPPDTAYRIRQYVISQSLISQGATISGYQVAYPYGVIYYSDAVGENLVGINTATNVLGIDIITNFNYDIVYDSNNANVFASNINVPSTDMRSFYYASIEIVPTIGANVNAFIDRNFVADGLYGNSNQIGSNSFAPSFLFNDITRTEAKTRQLVKLFGADYESSKELSESPNLVSLRIGYFLSPDVIQYHKNVCKYFYNFFFDLSIDEPNDNLSSRQSLHNTIGDFDTTFYFTSIKSIGLTSEIGLFTGGLLKEWKVKVKATITDGTKYHADLLALYNLHVGGGSTDDTVMWNDLRAWTFSTPPSSIKTEVRASMPPKTVKSASKPTKEFYVYCVEADIATVLHQKLFDGATEAYTILSYKEKKNITLDTASFEDYYYKRSVDAKGFVIYELYKRTSATTYDKVIMTKGSMVYNDGGSTDVSLTYGVANDESYRLPVLWSGLSTSNSFKEYVTIYDNSLCANMYVIQTTKLKWYQTSTFAAVLRIAAVIVAIVVAVVTAGAGASVSAVILNVATNLAVAYGISLAINYVGDKIGGDLGMIFKAVAIIVTAVVAGDVESVSALLLKMTDEFLKYKSYKMAEDTKEVVKKNKEFVEAKQALIREIDDLSKRFESDIDPETIIELMQRSTDSYDSIMNLDTAQLAKMFAEANENSWKGETISRADFLNDYSTYFDPTLDIPREVTEFEGNITSFEQFGDDDTIDIDL